MSAFSWNKAILKADAHILRQAKTQAKLGDEQTKLNHPDEVVEANRGEYTKLTKRIKEDLRIKRKLILERRERIAIGQR